MYWQVVEFFLTNATSGAFFHTEKKKRLPGRPTTSKHVPLPRGNLFTYSLISYLIKKSSPDQCDFTKINTPPSDGQNENKLI